MAVGFVIFGSHPFEEETFLDVGTISFYIDGFPSLVGHIEVHTVEHPHDPHGSL